MQPRSERDSMIRRCYQRALTMLRQSHDDEFQSLLQQQYEAEGLDIKKRKSRVAARRETIEKENTNGEAEARDAGS